jgi:RND family efflux transporter MFP subunit
MKYGYYFVLGCLLLFSQGCGKGNSVEDKGNGVRTINVETYTVLPRNFESYIHLPVVVSPLKEVNLGLTGGGKVTEIRADQGDFVREGAVLLRLDDEMLRANYDIAAANLEFQKTEYARTEQLYKEGNVSESMMDAAKLQLSQAQNTFTLAKKALDDAVLKAPFSGTITARLVEVGAILGPGTPAFRLIDARTVKVKTGIPEQYIRDFETGSNVTIKFDSLPDRAFRGTISYISPEADPQVRTFVAEINVANPEGYLKAGIMGNASVLRNYYPRAVVIPLNAVVETQTGPVVYTSLGDTTAHMNNVILGETSNSDVRIESGIQPGDRVIVRGQYDIVEGDRIRVTSTGGGETR